MLKAVACGMVKLPIMIVDRGRDGVFVHQHPVSREEIIDLCQKGARQLGWALRWSNVGGGEGGWEAYNYPPRSPVAVGSFEQCCQRIVSSTLEVSADDA